MRLKYKENGLTKRTLLIQWYYWIVHILTYMQVDNVLRLYVALTV